MSLTPAPPSYPSAQINLFQICPDSDLTNPLDVMNFMQSLASNLDGWKDMRDLSLLCID